MSFDPHRPVRTRDGRPARILCADREHYCEPIVALVTSEDGEKLMTYRADGLNSWFGQETACDLINEDVRRLREINAELLDALEALTQTVTEWSEEPCDDHSTIIEAIMCQVLPQCRAAIAKARGAP